MSARSNKRRVSRLFANRFQWQLLADKTGSCRKLLDFSLGRIPYRRLMSELDIETDEDLFLMMCGAGLPIPSLQKEELDKMAKIFEQLSNPG